MTEYRVGAGGARVVNEDGSVLVLPPGSVISGDVADAGLTAKRRPPHADKMVRDYEDKSTDFPDIGRH